MSASHVPDMLAALVKAQSALWQYSNDLRFPPTGDSVERRLEAATAASNAVDAIITKAAEAWIDWAGGACPVGPQTRVAVRHRNGIAGKQMAAKFYGGGHRADAPGYDITAYRVVSA